ncbi:MULTISPECIES: nuclear transport factor 2 family protein [unclassified Actinomyces]|uniref:nuclear transport factor 2 family protein n=1 Tax=unclassified Actinomyces TaxID=2609248 RepID=UPI002017F6ED|nr:MULTISPECIES: nuclear transport factor 2 family protein [unclassified Actinomyces]MCL3776899.1 nuclear transport factor 2 family protein [Actinomyces sp. AC-20-1]MCL3790322.1 nuclear transport factor 2 family protein [Actinomyces sp. 187325]MCL3792598.1 nuclear transport factor 2 family protein [Actinomyces sp. 186855]MCL3794207.1 nuclear transport factor 2 family protein [Actinomyces sp. 217892]
MRSRLIALPLLVTTALSACSGAQSSTANSVPASQPASSVSPSSGTNQPTPATPAPAEIRQPDSDRQAVIDRFQTHQAALRAGDVDTVAQGLAEDYVGTHMSGQTVTKQQSLEDLSSGDYQYHSFQEVSPIEVTVDGDTATLTVTADIEATVLGSHGTWRMTIFNTYRYEDGRWLNTSSTATRA